ncbi:MAG: DUF5011 domain-containing protein, partial [Thermoguttaceae bacterium]|nr:DUF5011 domain-containing protein [Thermoguttaceae bacterium]
DASVTVTSSITLGGQAVQSVDTSTAGTYTITYSASDSAGNVATPVTRTVTVAAASGSGSDSGDSGSGSGSGSGSNSGSGSGGTLTAPMAVEYHTTVSDNIPPNVPVWFRAVVIEPASGESSMASGVTNADRAWLTQPKTLRAIYDSNVLCLWRSGMTLSNSSRDNCFRARLEIGSGAATRVLRLDEIESIVYTIEQLGRQLTQPSATVAGHASVTIPACPWVLQNPITDTFWNADTTGYNFAHWPDSAEHFPFPTPGFYEVQYTFTTTGGQRLLLVFKVNVS